MSKEDKMRLINAEKHYLLESIHGSHHHTPRGIHFVTLI